LKENTKGKRLQTKMSVPPGFSAGWENTFGANYLDSGFAAQLKVQLHEKGILPTKAHVTDAGWDLYTPIAFDLFPDQMKRIMMKISITVPNGTYGRIAPRSGLAYKNNIDVMATIIVSKYLLVGTSTSNLIISSNGG